MSSLTRHEGVLLRDDRCSGGRLVEQAIATCSHCQRGVVMNPQRVRARAWCPKCDAYVCDWCEAERARTGTCRPMAQVFDELQNEAVLALGKG